MPIISIKPKHLFDVLLLTISPGRTQHHGFCSVSVIGHGARGRGFAGAGVGIGYIFGKMIEAVARQPEAEARVGKYMWIGFALVEAIALYGLVIAFIIMGLRK